MSKTRKGSPEELRRFPLDLAAEDRECLREMAKREQRSMAAQLRFLIRQAAEQAEEAAA